MNKIHHDNDNVRYYDSSNSARLYYSRLPFLNSILILIFPLKTQQFFNEEDRIVSK